MSVVSELKRAYKQGKDIAMNAPEVERKVKDATSNEKWGPTGTQMQEISKATYHFQDFPIIMSVIWKRINDPGKYWRHVYKSLLLIDYLIRNGSEQVIRECRNHIVEIQTLIEFQHIEDDKDVGLSVRERAKQVIELLHDDNRIKVEREKAQSNRGKYGGVGSDRGGYEDGGYGYGNGDRERGYGGGEDRSGYGGYGNDRSGGYGGDRDRSGGYGGDRDRSGGYGGDRDRGYGGGDRSGGYGGDRDRGYGGAERGSYGGDRDRGYGDRDSTRDFGKYDDGERENFDRDAPSQRTNSWDKPASSTRSTGSTGSTGSGRPRAASGGGGDAPAISSRAAPPPAAPNLLDVEDVLAAAPPVSQSSTADLFSINTGPAPSSTFGGSSFNTGSFGSTGAFGGTPTSFNFNQAPPPSGDFFDPRGGNAPPPSDDWGAFNSAAQPAGFDPFSSGGQQQGGESQQEEPKKDDPWAKKDLFNLDSLNLADKPKAATSTSSPNKVPMSGKAPMSKAPMSASATTTTSRPVSTTLTPTTLTPTPGPTTSTAFPPVGAYPGVGGVGYPPAVPGYPPGGVAYPPPGYAAPPFPYGAGGAAPPYGAAAVPYGAAPYGSIPAAGAPYGATASYGAAPRKF